MGYLFLTVPLAHLHTFYPYAGEQNYIMFEVKIKYTAFLSINDQKESPLTEQVFRQRAPYSVSVKDVLRRPFPGL